MLLWSEEVITTVMLRYLTHPRGNRIGPLSPRHKYDGLEVMVSVPKKANDAMHLSLLESCDVAPDTLGEVVLQDSFHVWDLRQIIKKGRERRVFLFDLHLLLAKEVKDSHGKAKYIYKTKFMTSELGVTEHIEGDECKFSVWTGREPMASDCRIVLKAPSLEVKQTWVRRLREVIQETYFSGALRPPRSPVRVRPTSSQRSSRDFDDTLLDENVDRNSLASFGSGNTTDSDKAGPEMTWVVCEHAAAGAGELTVAKGQQVEVVEACAGRPDWWLVRLPGEPPQEGAVPAHVLKPQPQHQTKTSPSRRPVSQPCDEAVEASCSDPGGGAVSAASPGKQRRGFSGRRWLGLRGKPSQGKSDKASTSGSQSPATADKPAPLKKIPSDKKLKLPYSGDTEAHNVAAALDETEDDAADLELPPPMKPIQDPQTVLQAPAPSTQAPQTEREQHGAAPATSKAEEEDAVQASSSVQPDLEAVLKKREYVLRELLDTEEIYVTDLQLIVEGYMRHILEHASDPTTPEGLRDRRYRMIFGNIEAIYEWHRDKFVADLRLCVEKPELLGPLFRRFLEKRMFLYEAYCRNKPVSEYIVSEHDTYFQEVRNKLGHKLQLADLLIKPIQRIQKYHLLVKKILSYSELANCPSHVVASLRDAMYCTDIIPKNANNMMDVGRLQGFTGNITAQGKLLLQETMFIADLTNNDKNREKEMHVFLFEQCIIFSEPVGKRSQFSSPTFNYKAHVQMNKITLEEMENTGVFMIHSMERCRQPLMTFQCRPPTEAKRREWLDTIKNILESQLNFGVALENPGAYLRELRDPAHLRKTESVPPSLGGSLAAEMRQRSQRPHAKANTINLPTTVRADDRKKTANAGLSKRPWALKLRRGAVEPGAEGERAPELAEPAADVTVPAGATATLACRALAPRATALWRKTAPDTRALRHGGRFAITLAADGLATLAIHACRASDAGVYCCLVSNDLGGVQTSARLTVGGGGPGAPLVRAHPAGGLVVQWDEAAPAHLECCRLGEGEWRRASDAPAAASTLALEELPPGHYCFRLVCARSGAAGAATGPAASGGGGAAWQQEQFARRYTLEEEIGRGRTATVIAARDTGTGQQVALKQVMVGRGADAVREYRMLSRSAHNGVVRALALFADVPRAGAHTLVLERAGGGALLEWAAAAPALHTQRAVATHARHLLSALHYLHTNNIAHLDVRPENILVELSGPQPQLKLIDLGSAAEVSAGAATGREVLPPAPAQLEFAPPECVLGRPPAFAWDSWAAGVFIYVFLTGLSPFLDESVEETTANIIKCDYCFPPEHWAGVDQRAQDLIRGLLDSTPARRLTPRDAMTNTWFDEAPSNQLSTSQLKTFLERRRPAGHNALHALRSPDTS